MKKTYKYWTKEDETLLEALRWSEKYSIAEIADHMGRTKSSVYNRLAILKRVEPKVRSQKSALDQGHGPAWIS